ISVPGFFRFDDVNHSFFLDERSSKDIFEKMFQGAIAEKQLSRIISKWEVFFEQLSICLNYLLATFVSGHGSLSRQKMDPKERNGLVILFQMTQGRCESTQRRTHFAGGFVC